jgi:hypothetical protein
MELEHLVISHLLLQFLEGFRSLIKGLLQQTNPLYQLKVQRTILEHGHNPTRRN